MDSFVVSLSTTRTYHGCLTFHPASSPCVHINHDPKTLILMVMKGKKKDKAAERILIVRKQTKVTDLTSLNKLLQKFGVCIHEEDEERIVF